MRNLVCLTFLLVSLAIVRTASAQTTLISDIFDRTGNLSGSSPDVTGGTAAGATWIVSSSGTDLTDSTATTNGSRLTITSASSNQEFAAIKFASSYASNTTYTLSYSLPTFTEPTGQDTWLQMGFTYNSTTGARSNTIGSIGVLRGAGNAQWSTSSANGSSTLVGGTITHTSLVDNATTGTMVTITLDTATGLENFYLGTLTPTGTPDYSFTYTTLPTVTSGLYVAIQNFSNTAPSGGPTVSNFPISQITLLSTPDVPEPSTYAMLLAGVGALAFIVRARRAAAAV